MYDTADDTWASIASMAASRYNRPALVAIGSSLLVMGGYSTLEGSVFDSAEAYDGAVDASTAVVPMGTAQQNTAAVAVVV